MIESHLKSTHMIRRLLHSLSFNTTSMKVTKGLFDKIASLKNHLHLSLCACVRTCVYVDAVCVCLFVSDKVSSRYF